MRKYLVVWIRLRPGTRPELLAAAKPFVAATRREEGCIFFEMFPAPADPDVVVVVECFTGEEAHAQHEASPHMATFRKVMNPLVVDAYFEHVFADPAVASGTMFPPAS